MDICHSQDAPGFCSFNSWPWYTAERTFLVDSIFYLLSICHGHFCASQDLECLNIIVYCISYSFPTFFLLEDPRKTKVCSLSNVPCNLKDFFCHFNYFSLCDLGYLWRLLIKLKIIAIFFFLRKDLMYPGWPRTCYLANNGLGLLIPLCLHPKRGFLSLYHNTWFMWWWWATMASWIPGRHSTLWAVFLVMS